MSFLGALFGGGQSPPQPQPAPAAPSISDATVAAADREETARLQNRRGVDQAMLTTGLGDTGSSKQNVQRTTLLGGGGTVSQ